jgi:hypothetical protein
MNQTGADRASHEYLGREFTLGGFFRVEFFGPGIGENKVRSPRKHIAVMGS